MDNQVCGEVTQQPIRPVVYGIGFYFLLAATDSFRIGTIGSLLKIAAFLPLLLLLFDVSSLKIRFSPLLILHLLYWLLTLFSLFYTVSADRTLASAKTLTLNLLLVFSLGALLEYRVSEIQLMKKCLLLGGWITILLMFIFSDFSVQGRMTLLLGQDSQDQNYINGYFLYAFSHHCSELLLKKKKIQIIPTAVILATVLLTGSRGALIAFAAVLFAHVCILFSNSKHRFRNILLVALLIVLIFIIFDYILDQMPEQVAQRYSWDYIAEKGSTGRTKIWNFLLHHYSNSSIPRMLFGHGYGSTPLINTLNNRVAHNLYLDNLITLGIMGLLLQLLLQGTVLLILFRSKERILFCAYIGMICMSLSMSLTSYKPIWNIILLAFVLHAHSDMLPENASSGIPTQEVHP